MHAHLFITMASKYILYCLSGYGVGTMGFVLAVKTSLWRDSAKAVCTAPDYLTQDSGMSVFILLLTVPLLCFPFVLWTVFCRFGRHNQSHEVIILPTNSSHTFAVFCICVCHPPRFLSQTLQLGVLWLFLSSSIGFISGLQVSELFSRDMKHICFSRSV
jgi:hypothetical protein